RGARRRHPARRLPRTLPPGVEALAAGRGDRAAQRGRDRTLGRGAEAVGGRRAMNLERRLLDEQGGPGHRGPELPACDVPHPALSELLGGAPLRNELAFPQVSEPEVIRHFVELSVLNHHIDKGFYPLGSCTMKHNPKINDELAALPGLALAHPLASD